MIPVSESILLLQEEIAPISLWERNQTDPFLLQRPFFASESPYTFPWVWLPVQGQFSGWLDNRVQENRNSMEEICQCHGSPGSLSIFRRDQQGHASYLLESLGPLSSSHPKSIGNKLLSKGDSTGDSFFFFLSSGLFKALERESPADRSNPNARWYQCESCQQDLLGAILPLWSNIEHCYGSF